MIVLRIVLVIVTLIGVALLLGWTEKNVKSSGARASIWIAAIIVLLSIGFWDSRPFVLAALFLAMLLQGLEHIPSWLIWTILGFCAGIVFRHILILIARSISDVGVEIEKTNTRIALMENSISHKLDEISSRLPEE